MDPLARFGAATSAWFTEAFEAPTRIQREGWPPIGERQHTLLLAPTGSGKTLAAFLTCIDRLCRRPAAQVGIGAVYISPLKALVYDVERNLRAPIAGVRRTAERLGQTVRLPRVDVRTGDTSQRDRRLQQRDPADILVTTPESLYLLLTSGARENLRHIDTVIVDEIHVMAGTKRGVHLALTLERLAALTDVEPQRIGLSATQRPLERIARFLGGDRPVTIIDASEPPRIDLRITVPVDDMNAPPRPPDEDRQRVLGHGGGQRSQQPAEHGIWPSVYPAILAEIRKHRSTIVFTNSRQLAERLAQKLNEYAGEELVFAHHGSISHKRREEIEEALKAGQVPALVATSSLELGIDMGAVDLVILVESPGAASRGLQRVGRAGHSVGEISEGTIFPKYRGDLLEATVVAKQMLAGEIEATSTPSNCLDVLAQQIVAMVAMDSWPLDELERTVRRAAPFAGLTREVLTATLDMLSGRFPSDEFAELTPRINWDRDDDLLTPRRSARTLAVMNAGTIPDRGLYRVQLSGDGPRLGELDEEMVYETRPGDTLILGASTWRVDAVERDRVLVSPAPGQAGRLPFWRGERPGRPLELGQAMGAFLGAYDALPATRRGAFLDATAPLDAKAKKNLADYIEAQKEATGCLPTDKALTVERFRDELGDWRICVLSPFGSRVHSPWALALEAQLSLHAGFDVQVLYSDDGIALRLIDTEDAPDPSILFPAAEEVEDLIVEQLGHSALFASRFRENAARALLLPRRRINGRTPLWLQRRKSEALLSVARRFPSFPIVLETYRECLQDVFDLPALRDVLGAVERREIRIDDVETRSASPFARSLAYQYVAAYLYEGDAPLAERKAAALTLDRNLLRDLLGQEELRELLDPLALAEVEAELQWLDGDRFIHHADAVQDLLRRLGDLSTAEIEARAEADPRPWLDELAAANRAVEVRITGEPRWIAVEDAARYRDGLGVSLPAGIAAVFLEVSEAPLATLLLRWARTHGPFVATEPGARWGMLPAQIEALCAAEEVNGTLIRGEIRPGGAANVREWCDPEVLRRLKRRSLARLRNEVAPVDADVLARFVISWHGVHPESRRVRRPLPEIIDQLEGLALPFSVLESEILPARLPSFDPSMLDQLGASGALVWIGRGPLGIRDGKVALYQRERVPLLLAPPEPSNLEGLPAALLAHVLERGASFFVELQRAADGASTEMVLEALWQLVWAGLVTNDTFAPLRGLRGSGGSRRDRKLQMIGGRWSAVAHLVGAAPEPTTRLHAQVNMLLERYGVVSREAAIAAEVQGGFQAMYPVLRLMEEAGKVRRGLFVDGLGGAQFALSGAVDRLRGCRARTGRTMILSATDPANPWGALLPWSKARNERSRPRRVPGAHVVLVDGEPVLFLDKGGRSLLTFETSDDSDHLRRAVKALNSWRGRRPLWLKKVDGAPADNCDATPALLSAGFTRDYRGLSLER